MVAVRLEGVTKTFGAVVAVDNVSLEIRDGELFFLLGPSGCGKTTVLRTIAGFEVQDRGRVFFDARDLTAVAPHKRNTGMVFQNYALWPHMSVFDNVAYGLRVRSVDKPTLRKRVASALEMVRMSREQLRFPNQLSGGQQQRVALARALVVEPACLLLDEPLSNLDAQLRLEMRAEIRRIHAETCVTTIYVTHDQKEALSMAERLAVLKDGRIMQVGRAEDIYRAPANNFVAAFIGETNAFPGRVVGCENLVATVDTDIGKLVGRVAQGATVRPGQGAIVCIRPEDVSILSSSREGTNVVRAYATQYTFLGEVGQLVARAGNRDIRLLVMAPAQNWRREELMLFFPENKVLVFPSPAGESREEQ